MALFGFLFNKQNKLKKSKAEETDTPVSVSGSGVSKYKNAIELAKIITNNDKAAVRDITLLATDFAKFFEIHNGWCDFMYHEIGSEIDYDTDILWLFAYWLTGYETDCKYGAYIDWKEETKEIIYGLALAIKNLRYPLDVHKIEFDGGEFTADALQKIHAYFFKQGFSLVALDTQSDCYHLYVIKTKDGQRLAALGNEIGFRFYSNFK